MIVRISGEDQYRLEDADASTLNSLDDAVQEAIEAGDEEAFQRSFQALLDFVRSEGRPVAEDDLEGSDIILPPPDLTLAEARDEFSAEGLIPD